MEQIPFFDIKKLLKGSWIGEGFAKFPTISDTGYTELLTFTPDDDKDSIHFNQKTWYKNDTEKNGKTVFWDTGFIFLKEGKILLVSAQVGGRVETFQAEEYSPGKLIFESIKIDNDPKTIRSQRILKVSKDELNYELNMSTHQATDFQNHLSASLKRVK
jgi:THAP4-like, heme-binding beta-barrel domain